MAYEIDFLSVGNGEKSGDAIAVRYGTAGDYKIMVIDGGSKESGENLVAHIKKYYQTDVVDFVVNTHPDGDHASGLSVVLEQLTVKQLWMHRPWDFSSELLDKFKDGRITDNSLSERIKDGLNYAYALEKLAKEKKIPICDPFQGRQIGIFTLLSPSKEKYLELVPHFTSTPDAKKEQTNSFLAAGKAVLEAVKSFIYEHWNKETLSEEGTTSAQNTSSIVLHAEIDGKQLFFCGDAGVDSLNWAADYAEASDIDLTMCRFMQIPHHASRNNVSPSVLNRIVGGILPEGQKKDTKLTVYVSASKNSETHPRKSVINAYTRRGANVYATNGNTIWHHNDMPARADFSGIEPFEIFTQVEA